MIAIVIIGAALAAVGEVWSTQARREREVELIYRGDAIRRAIGFFRFSGGRYPLQLEDLVRDNGAAQTRRFLRRLYADPMTGLADWTLIRAPDGGIMGVASASKAKPLKRSGFNLADETFSDADCYCDWQFIYSPPSLQRGPLGSGFSSSSSLSNPGVPMQSTPGALPSSGQSGSSPGVPGGNSPFGQNGGNPFQNSGSSPGQPGLSNGAPGGNSPFGQGGGSQSQNNGSSR
ncbi:MAG TPA: hypothetical protein VF848_09000 [Steroidobacteraceae bacterium]